MGNFVQDVRYAGLAADDRKSADIARSFGSGVIRFVEDELAISVRERAIQNAATNQLRF